MRWIASLALIALASTAPATGAEPTQPTGAGSSCEPRQGLEFLCGPSGSEDLVSVPGTSLLLVSGLGLGKPGHVYLVDRNTRRFSVAFGDGKGAVAPGRDARGCPGAPGADSASYAGLGLRREADGRFTLYAANDLRNAIEIFRFDAGTKQLQWTGCVVMPAGTTPNGVAALPKAGFLATSFRDHSDPTSWDRMARGEPSGGVYEWQADKGLHPVPGLERLSGPNGVESSADGREIYVSVWATRKLLVVSRATGRVRTLPLDFMPDNIHANPDGSLTVAGQRTTVDAVSHCGRDCPQPWVVARIDPARGSIGTLLQGAGDSQVNYACGAVSIEGRIYATVRGEDRLVIGRH